MHQTLCWVLGYKYEKNTALGKILGAHNLAANSANLFRFETEFGSALLMITENKFEKNQDNSGNNIPAPLSKEKKKYFKLQHS